MPELSLMVTFRRSGWRWPLAAGDAVLIYAPGGHLVAEIPGPFLLAIMTHYLRGAALQTEMGTHVTRPVLPPPRLPAAAGRRLRGR